MIKRIFSAFICLVLVLGAFTITAFADPEDVKTKVGDVKLYTEKTQLEKGDFFTVEIYVENITAKEGILGADLPLTYDKSKLSYIKKECVFPASWGMYGEFIGHDTPDEDPWYLRTVSTASDYVTNPAYRIKADKEIGYKITFKAVAEGEAFVAVENAGNNNIMLPSLEERVMNYGGNGMTLKLTIGTEDTSSDAPVESDDSSSVPDDNSSEITTDVSFDVSDEPFEDLNSSEDISVEESADVTSSEDVSAEESSASDASVPEASVGEEQSDTASEESKAPNASEDGSNDEGDGDESQSGGIGIVGIVLLAAGAFVIIALAGVGAFLVFKGKKND